MNFIPLLLLSIISIVSSCVTRFNNIDEESEMAQRKIDRPNWYCGTGRWVQDIAWSSMFMCLEKEYDFNHCCAIHDDCYEQQAGQEKCDKNFCDCNSKAIENSWLQLRCEAYTKPACNLVNQFGKAAYEASSYHNVTVTPYVLTNDEDLAKVYPTIFENCKLQNATFSSCAYNFDTCIKDKWANDCNDQLRTCLTATKDSRAFDETCDSAVERVVDSILDGYLYW